jgi:hypothetical protein
MKTNDDITNAKNAWMLWKSLADLERLLWDIYCDDFLDFDDEERMVSNIESL